MYYVNDSSQFNETNILNKNTCTCRWFRLTNECFFTNSSENVNILNRNY